MESNLKIGARIRHARKVKRLTLKDLAGVIGCSESLLSKVENEKAVPSLQMLHKIVNSLDITIGHLMEVKSKDSGVITRKGDRRTLKFEEGQAGEGTQIEWLIPQVDTRLLQASIHVIAPGTGSKGLISHEGEEMGYVLEGTVSIEIGGETYEVEEGDSFFFQSHIPHGYINNGSKVAKILWATTPPTF